MSLVDLFDFVSLRIIICVRMFIVIIDIVGNVLNTLVFLSLQTLPENSCAFCLTAL